MWVLRLKRRLRIPDVRQEALEQSEVIDRQIVDAGLAADGPWHFVAHNLPRDSKTPFDWEIWRPDLKPDAYAGTVELHHAEPIMVASCVHQGSLRSLFTRGYAPLVTEIELSRHHFSGESREAYHTFKGQKASYQKIELQFGLSR